MMHWWRHVFLTVIGMMLGMWMMSSSLQQHLSFVLHYSFSCHVDRSWVGRRRRNLISWMMSLMMWRRTLMMLRRTLMRISMTNVSWMMTHPGRWQGLFYISMFSKQKAIKKLRSIIICPLLPVVFHVNKLHLSPFFIAASLISHSWSQSRQSSWLAIKLIVGLMLILMINMRMI